ncbi:FAD-dependent oxidoreductase [Vibrio caribbeanicus]|uniref:FAD dependent oxidoreductase domain-containing protein n=1 Tax=Vibrio caribbeanicus ATCC BAA-2122 TaxID=796620 RepID=E3BKB4_9VIBR|nr:FAD-dependent oxidoreductase [Vibrio caribbeanicus]EFP96499.1 hypothetical protein VIBC2010_04954 [Vibrio caribbeanicus ATCC BAA-2122]
MQFHKQSSQCTRVAIVGGGVAGATAALHMSELGFRVFLLEKSSGLVNGPPICHLHAGGNLYPDISTNQCLRLLKQSIDTIRLYHHTINRRPTVIAIPKNNGLNPLDLKNRLDLLKQCYSELIAKDPLNKVLGEPSEYYKLFSREDLESLASLSQPDVPSTFEDWLIPFACHTNFDDIKFPIIAVEEHGWSVFRLAAVTTLALEKLDNCELMLESELIGMEEGCDGWELKLKDSQGQEQYLDVDYVVNACGYKTGTLDDWANKKRERMVEFKAAYVTRWSENKHLWPEVIFHGERGTPNGMAQLTPYSQGIFQLHGMTKNVTLFENGLVCSSPMSSQPLLPRELQEQLDRGWNEQLICQRSQNAIDHIGQYIPDYVSARVYGKPLYGAQQIPGKDKSLRAADVTFEGERYGRIETVKGSSCLEAAMKLVLTWGLFDYKDTSIESLHSVTMSLSDVEIEQKAQQLAFARGYPVQLAQYYGNIN